MSNSKPVSRAYRMADKTMESLVVISAIGFPLSIASRSLGSALIPVALVVALVSGWYRSGGLDE